MKKEGLREQPYFREIWQKLPRSTSTLSFWPEVAAREAGGAGLFRGCPPHGRCWGEVHPGRPPGWWPCDSLSQPPAERIRCSRNWGVPVRGERQVRLEPGLGRVSSGLTPCWAGPCSRRGHFSPWWGTPAAPGLTHQQGQPSGRSPGLAQLGRPGSWGYRRDEAGGGQCRPASGGHRPSHRHPLCLPCRMWQP